MEYTESEISAFMIRTTFVLSLIFLLSFACSERAPAAVHEAEPVKDSISLSSRIAKNDSLTRTIHIFVALCDNKYQGIVPVPAGIGNGQDPKNNLYWGAGYGLKSFFSK